MGLHEELHTSQKLLRNYDSYLKKKKKRERKRKNAVFSRGYKALYFRA